MTVGYCISVDVKATNAVGFVILKSFISARPQPQPGAEVGRTNKYAHVSRATAMSQVKLNPSTLNGIR